MNQKIVIRSLLQCVKKFEKLKLKLKIAPLLCFMYHVDKLWVLLFTLLLFSDSLFSIHGETMHITIVCLLFA